jgi:cobalamin-dependent methionine synthase I
LIFATPKYLASGLAKYQPLTLAVGSMAYELVRVIPVFFSTLSDIELYDENDEVLMTLNHLRQQLDKKGNMPNFCLSDFIAPKDNDIQD